MFNYDIKINNTKYILHIIFEQIDFCLYVNDGTICILQLQRIIELKWKNIFKRKSKKKIVLLVPIPVEKLFLLF